MLRLCLIFTLIFLLMSCASQPKKVILSPQFSSSPVSTFDVSLSIRVKDLRTSKFTLRVLKQEPAVYLPDSDLPLSIQSQLEQAFTLNGAHVQSNTDNQLILEIELFKADITESIANHTSQAIAKWHVKASKAGKTFSKTYQTRSELTGPLTHEQAKIETQLNELTEIMINRIVADQILLSFYKEK